MTQTDTLPYRITHISPEALRAASQRVRFIHQDHGTPITAIHPLHATVRQAVTDFNRAHPQTLIHLPKFVYLYTSSIVNAEYLPDADMLKLSSAAATFPKPLLKAIVAHELGHKLQHSQQGETRRSFSVDAMIAAFQPNLIEQCRSAGLSSEQTYMFLPGNSQAFRPDNQDVNLQQDLRRQIDTANAQHVRENRFSRLYIRSKIALTPACRQGIGSIWAALPDTLAKLEADTRSDNYRSEFEADDAAVNTYGPQLAADALIRVIKSAPKSSQDGVSPHPPLDQRIARMGCTLRQESGQTIAECPSGASAATPKLPRAHHRR